MHICFFSVRERAAALDHPELRSHRITQMVGGLEAMAAAVKEQNPDLVFIQGFEQGQSLLEALRRTANATPSATLIPIIVSPQPEFLLQAMRVGVREVLPSDSLDEIAQAILRIIGGATSTEKQARSDGKPAARIGFMSAKGGDGGSSVSANFAAAIAKSGESQVLLLDLAIPFGDVEMYVTSANPSNDLSDISGEVDRLDQTLLVSLAHHVTDSLDLITSPKSFEKVINLQPQDVDRVIETATLHYDYIVFDIGTRFDAIGIEAIEKLDRLFLVVTQNVSSIRRAGHELQLLEMLGFDMSKVSLLLNRFSIKEPIGPTEIENALKQPVFRKLGTDADGLRESMIKGAPYISLFPKTDFAKGIANLAEEWLGKPKEEKSAWRRFAIR